MDQHEKMFITGTRGIPDILGGVETHCENLYPRIAREGASVTLARRSAYVAENNRIQEYKGVDLVDIYSPHTKSLEAIVHTFFSVLYAWRRKFKFVHIHAIGPSLVIPFARLLGLKVVMTHHGPDYERQKWGRLATLSLRLGEWCAAKFSNEIIVISKTINTLLREKYHRNDAHLIANGVVFPDVADGDDYIRGLGLEPCKYIIAVGRFVPEKGFHDLLDCASEIDSQYKVVLVGDADHRTEYSEQLKKNAQSKGIVLTGFIKGRELNQIFTHAALFVMPSYHEGLPIALLEALSYNLRVVVSDIPANAEVGLEESNYFAVGNGGQLSSRINEQLSNDSVVDHHDWLAKKYNWDTIAEQTLSVYRRL